MPESSKPRVFLIDAMSFIFRAYHAMARQRPMSTKTGIPTAATYVFVNMLKKLRADFSPEYLAAVFDVAGPTFRDTRGGEVASVRKFDIKTQSFKEEAYGGYKAQRSEMPPDLAQQLPYIRRALEAYRIPILEYSGVEADDVLGTLARKAAIAGHGVYVVSSDKDMLQLVDDKVCVLNPPKDNLICDAAKVEEILGVRPEQVIDVMALRGDSIDNIPGAPGIGEKGSTEIIRRFGTLENALEHAAEVEKKTYRESLQNNREQILYSKAMVTIDQNVPIELDLEKMRAPEPDNAALRKLFSELEFTTLLAEVSPSGDLGETDYRQAKSAADVEKVLKQAAKAGMLAVAVQSALEVEAAEEKAEQEDSAQAPELPLLAAAARNELSPGSVAVSAKSGEALTIKFDSAANGGPSSKLCTALADAKIPKAIHDSKATTHALARCGLTLAGVEHDPQLYSYLLNPTYSSHGLEPVALRVLNFKLSGEVSQAADLTLRLAIELSKEVEAAGLMKVYREIDLPLVPVLARMEQAGVKIDTKVLAEMSKRLERECDAKAKEVHALAKHEFNINSPKQLGDVLFNKLGLPKPVKYGRGKTISTAVEVLEELATEHEVARRVLEYRQLSKLKSTYVDALPALLNSETKRLHTTFIQTGTATGRLSSINPNLQNIPIRTELGREIRAAFVAEKGDVLLAADYSQIELRLLAHYSEDALLTEAFRRGDDIHTLTAQQVFGVADAEHRRRAKVINFGIVYGLSPFGLAQNLGIEQTEAKQFIDAYFAKYAGVRKFIDETLAAARRDSYVKTLFGRVRPIPDINSKNSNMRGFAERTAVNTPLQGTAADLIKLAMIRIDAELDKRKLKSQMTLQVHDELVFEVPKAELDEMRTLVQQQMESVHKLRVPLTVEIGVGQNWRDLEFGEE
jgi:DNA polymerase-1